MSTPADSAASAFAEDYELVYPALPRSDLEQLLAAIKNLDALTDAVAVSAAVEPWSPVIAGRIRSFAKAKDRVGYVRRLRGLLVLALAGWKEIDCPPDAREIYNIVCTIEGD
jgi:hypothetical protein